MSRGVCLLFLLSSLFGWTEAHARVQWSGRMDVRIGPGGSPDWLPAASFWTLDLNADGVSDYEFQFTDISDFVASSFGTNAITTQDHHPRLEVWESWPHATGFMVDGALDGQTQWGTNDYILSSWRAAGGIPTGSGPWNGTEPGFMGVRFHAADGTHYGWIRLSVYDEFPGIVIHDWAYETVPDRGIVAGTMLHYVSPTGHHLSPYTNWTDAATNIQAAVDVAQYGAMVLVTDSTYFVNSPIAITNGISVLSVNGRDKVTIDAQQNGRCLYVDHPDALLDGFAITRGKASIGGGILCSNGTVRSCIVSNNSAVNPYSWLSSFGGGIYCGPGGVISNCVITCNVTSGSGGGGGAYCSGGLIQNCTIRGNTSAGTGGGAVIISGGAVRDSVIISNSASGGGGAGCAYTGTIQRCTLSGNQASGGMFPSGGGVLSFWGGQVLDCVVTANSAESFGGGVLCWQSSLAGCSILGNSASEGGGVFIVEGPLMGMDPPAGVPPTIASCVVAGNSASTNGGGISATGGTIQNCTVSDNSAVISGGGVFCVSNATVRNTIIHGNTAGADSNVATAGAGSVFSYSCASPLLPGSGNIADDPLLTPSYHLKGMSPCIDAGTELNSPPSDIDGEARWDHPGHSNVVSIVDIGADEFVDTDLDLMADYWETLAFGSITNRDGTADTDGDALNDLAEYENSTTPTNPDSDSDGMPDGWEVAHSLNPLTDDAQDDPDFDTMRNLGEYVSDTDPRDATSVLSLIRIDRQLGGTRLDWKGGREAWQILECRGDLVSTTEQWTAIFALPPPTALTNAVIDMGATNRTLFYRIRAER